MLSVFARNFVTDSSGSVKNVIYGLQVFGRQQHAVDVQKALTEHGCAIGTRLGLHHTDERYCAPHGLILCQMTGEANAVNNFEKDIAKINGVQLQKMEFTL
ncbi:hypothetical protein J8273_8527 [Carpediemonas membranifera]|uniref:Uncharacterized protein n=1 Tax=Carpediemonas membranifera TaxID=201153 RepID=A0A8J6APS2_9EUKA|nr:hypothetical protein J8273_8527 [Carpediemonas membranifera]|eukprot:KAG9389848.1 hypothetical protein J8273_8527 [Carpediemonas membranifera]